MLSFTFEAMEEARKIAAGGGEEECGGLLFGLHPIVRKVHYLPNTAANPRHAWEVSAKAIARALRRAECREEMLLGTFHSHPLGIAELSRADAGLLPAYGALLLVASPVTDRSRWDWALYEYGKGRMAVPILPPSFLSA